MTHNRPPATAGPEQRELLGGLRNTVVSLLLLLVGVWLFVGAWIIGYPFTAPAVDAHLMEMIIGIVVFLVAVARLVRPRGPLSDVLVLVAGVALAAAPFVFGYGDTYRADAARVNDVVTGVVLVLLAAVSLVFLKRARSGSRGGTA
ncbi:SPW repeat domain-containing protein [Streptomyces sparsus]